MWGRMIQKMILAIVERRDEINKMWKREGGKGNPGYQMREEEVAAAVQDNPEPKQRGGDL